jgi:hypothetical protein
MRLAVDKQTEYAENLVGRCAELGDDLVTWDCWARINRRKAKSRRNASGCGVVRLNRKLAGSTPPSPRACGRRRFLVRKSVWLVGGDGWAYDIGAAGSTTFWARARTSTCWCSTPRRVLEYRRADVEVDAARRGGEVRRMAASRTAKKDLAMEAISLWLGLRGPGRHGRQRHPHRARRSRRRRPMTARRSSSPTAIASRMATTCVWASRSRKAAVLSGLLAADALRPAAARRGQEPVPTRLEGAERCR